MGKLVGKNDHKQADSDATGKQSKVIKDSRGHAPTHDEIQLRAYWIHLGGGGEHGCDFEDWLRAERELTHELPENPNIEVRPD